MNTPTDLTIWLRDQAWPIGILLFIAIFTYVSLRAAAASRRNALAKERADITNESFTAHLEQFGFDPTIASSTYRYLQEVQHITFPILATDALDEDLGLGLEEVEQTVRELTVALGRERIPLALGALPITVEDLVRALQASPRVMMARSSAA